MKFHTIILTGFVLATIFLSACSGGAAAPTVAPPTAVQEIPTVTPIPPTDTPVPAIPSPTAAATASSSGNASQSNDTLSSAVDKAKAATTYRMEMQMSATGAFGLTTAQGTPAAEPNQTVSLFSLNGQVKDKDSHIQMQGLLAAFLGADPNKGLEIISLGDKAFVHGPVSMLGAAEDKWYEMPASQATAVRPPLTSQSFLDSLTQSGMNPSDFKKTGTEALDNQSCDVYAGDKDVVLKAFQNIGQAAGGTANSSQVIDNADFRFWICSDGFLHQVRMAVDGHSKDTPDQKGSFLMLLHLSDINGSDIQIQAPANAEPLKLPSFLNTPTPTP